MDEDLKIIVTSELEADEQASAQRISAQLPNIAKLINARNSIKVGITLDDSNIQTEAQKVSRQIAQATKTHGVGVTLNLDKSSVSKIKTELQNLKVNPDISRAMTDQLDKMGIQIDRITGRWEKVNGQEERMLSLNIQGTDQMQRTVSYLQTYDAETGEINTHLTSITSNLEQQRQAEAKLAAQAKANNESRISYLTKQKAILADIQSSYAGETSVKPVNDSSHLEDLRVAYAAIETQINNMIGTEGQLNKVQRANLEAQISDLKRLAKEYQNAEYVATSLRTKSFDAVKVDQFEALNTLADRLKSNNILTDEFKANIDALRTSLQNVGNKDQLVAFLNSFDELNNKVSGFQERLRGVNAIYTQLMRVEAKMTGTQSAMMSLDPTADKDKLAVLQEQLAVYETQKQALNDQLTPYAAIIQYAKQAEAAERARLENELRLKFSEAELADKAREIDAAMQRVPTTIEDLQVKFSQLVTPTATLVENMRLLRETEAQYGADKTDSEKIAIYERLNELAASCRSEISELMRVQRGDVLDFKFTTDLEKNKADLAAIGRQWSALRHDPGLNTQFLLLQENLKHIDNQMDLKKWTSQFSAFKAEVKAAGKNMQSLGDILKNNLSKVMQWVSATTLLFRAFRLLKDGISTVIDLNTAMIDLRKTTNATEAEYKQFYFTANETAKQLGATTESVIEQTAEWSRLGYSIKEAAELSKNSAIFAAVSPEMNQETATDGLVSIIKAFDFDVNDTMDGIISKVNAVGNAFAVSNADIVEALTRSSSAMAAANNTFEETVALATAATEITRDASGVGNGLKTLSMRIRGYDEETEEYSDDIAELTGEIADLTKTASNAQGVSLFEPGDPETYRSTYDILADIADIWDEITDKNQAQLLEALFGKRQAQIGSAILSNFDQARESIVKMEDSAGSADREMEKITQSLEYKLNALKQTWVSVAQSLFDQKPLGGVIDALTTVSGWIDTFTSKFGLLGVIIAGTVITELVKFKSTVEMVQTSVMPVVASVQQAQAAMNGGVLSTQQYATELYGLSVAQQKAAMSALGLSSEQKKQILNLTKCIGYAQKYTIQELAQKAADNEVTASTMAKNMAMVTGKRTTEQITSAMIQEILSSKELDTVQKQLIIDTLSQSAANEKQALSLRAVGAAMLANPMTWITLIPMAIGLITSLVNKIAEMRQKSIDTANDIIDAYENANTTFNSNIKTLEGLRKRFDQLSDGVNTNGDNISLTADEYSEYLSIISQIVDISPDIVQGYDNEGQAILNYKSALDDAIGSQETYIKNQRDIYLGQGKEIFDGKSAEWEDAAKELGKAGEKLSESAMGSISESLFNTDKAQGMIDAWYDALREVGIDWTIGVDTWSTSADKVMSIYENYDKIMVLLRNSGAYTEEELSEVQTSLQGLAGSFTKLNSIEKEQITYLTEWSKAQNWYNDIPVDAVDEFASGLAAVNDPLKSYNENVQAAARYGNDFVTAITGDSAKSLIELSKGLSDGTVSIEDYNAAVEKFKDSFDGDTNVLEGLLSFFNSLSNNFVRATEDTGGYTAKLSELKDVLSGLQTAYSALDAAKEDMSTGNGLSAETISKLASAEDNYLDYLYEENGVVKLNTEAWKENANAKMQSEMSEIQKEINSLEERNAVLKESIQYYQEQQSFGNDGGLWSSKISEATSELEKNNQVISENQGKLAIYSSLYGSITGDLDAYTAALNNWQNVSTTIDSMTSSFQRLANLQAEVANGFTMSLEKAMEFASVYPQILNNAQVTADGQVALNEGVVNSFIQGKKAELDAQIDTLINELEAEKAKDEAKMQSAQAQLDLAKSVGEGEGQITKELAEYRISTGNIVAQALIDAGIDEATSFKLAAAAMAQNAEEFDRVATEVCTDVNGNFNQAAYNLAQTMYNNLASVKTNLSDVAKQAHQTAQAIAGVASGKITGSTGIVNNGGGGVAGSGISLNLTSESFDGTDYSYEAKETNLEDFISQIELDISSYQDAITQIDSQIATLQALKNIPLKNFKTDTSSSKGSGSSKEVEEYVATIDDYREAIERLRKAQEARAEIEDRIDNSDNLKEQILLERQLIDAYQREQEALHNLNNQRDSTITSGVAALRELGFAVQYNADTNELWIDNMEHLNELTADSKGEYDSLQEATNALRENTEDLINSLTDLNDENREGSKDWQELSNSVEEARKQINELLDEIVKEASDAVDSIQEVYDTLHDAADEYAASGYVTIDTLQSITALGQKYMAYLMDENGQLVINEERIRDVIKARTQELAIESSLSYVEALRIARQANDIETLNNLLYATEAATNATWGFVYASLAMAGLDETQYQAALQNINALRSLADSACESIGKTADSVTDGLEQMQDGLNDILDRVMDMLKQKINDQIDALEDMKDSYSDLISMKKDSLQASKDEADYQKDMAKKLKEIAKLQARIDALSLDDSREAQAEKKSLLDELAELQEDLANSQADKAIETQEDALDAQEKAYSEEKDKEIAILEDSISSYQKLYDMAIEYIDDHWNTLYDELIDYNYEYGDILSSEITSAWDECLAAAQRYGDFVSALNTIGGDIESSQAGGQNTTVGNTQYGSDSTNEDNIHAIIKQMYENSQTHHNASDADKKDLHNENLRLGAQLAQYGVNAVYDNGYWYVDRVGGQLLYDKYKNYIYHKGGIAGENGTVKDNEILAKLEKGEPVLTTRMWDNLTAMMGRMDKLSDAFANLPYFTGSSIVPDFLRAIGGANNNIKSNQSIDFSPEVSITIEHNGAISDSDMMRFGKIAADSTLQELSNAFSKKGFNNIGNAMLK